MRAQRQGRWWKQEHDRRDHVPGEAEAEHPRRACQAGSRALPVVLRTVLLLVPALGCGDGDALKPPTPVADRELYWELQLNHHAVLMSSTNPLYDTLTLVATPRNRFGEALPLGTPSFTSPNPDQLLVSPTGQLIAVAPTSEPLPIVASLTAGNLKYADTAYVIVVDNPDPPRLATFSAHPVPPDSAKVPMGSFCFCDGDNGEIFAVPRPQATDSNGNVISGLPIYVRSSDPRVLRVSKGGSASLESRLHGVRPGMVNLYVSTTAFGITRADTVPYRVGWPISRRLSVERSSIADASTLTVGVGALIVWIKGSGIDTLDVTFSDADLPHIASMTTYHAWENFFGFNPDAMSSLLPFFCVIGDCGDGNIVNRDVAFRVFPTAGTYEYSFPREGVGGRIVVVDETVPPPD